MRQTFLGRKHVSDKSQTFIRSQLVGDKFISDKIKINGIGLYL